MSTQNHPMLSQKELIKLFPKTISANIITKIIHPQCIPVYCDSCEDSVPFLEDECRICQREFCNECTRYNEALEQNICYHCEMQYNQFAYQIQKYKKRKPSCEEVLKMMRESDE